MKILVFNIELSIKDAIEAMIKEDIYCGLIWDSELVKFVSIFTIRDFLNLIRLTHEKVKAYIQSKGNLSINLELMVQHLFNKNNINIEDLDIIMETVESNTAKQSENKSMKSYKSDVEMKIEDDEEMLVNNKDVDSQKILQLDNQTYKGMEKLIEFSLNTYKDFFRIFEFMNISDYLSDYQPVKSFNKFRIMVLILT
jgi:hypothetical protein